MKKIFSNPYLLLASRLVIGFMFIYAGAEKISDPAGFSQSIANYKLLPIWLINFLAIILPWIELISGVLLVFGISVKENSTIISVLLSIFIIAIAISLFRGLSIDCGCFGKGSTIGWYKIGENLLMLVFSLALIAFDSHKFALTNNKQD